MLVLLAKRWRDATEINVYFSAWVTSVVPSMSSHGSLRQRVVGRRSPGPLVKAPQPCSRSLCISLTRQLKAGGILSTPRAGKPKLRIVALGPIFDEFTKCRATGVPDARVLLLKFMKKTLKESAFSLCDLMSSNHLFHLVRLTDISFVRSSPLSSCVKRSDCMTPNFFSDTILRLRFMPFSSYLFSAPFSSNLCFPSHPVF